MPLHLLGKKSWNVYNADNIARVKADEAEAAAREAADEQRMQELDAARRAAILRGRTPPPLPEETKSNDTGRRQPRNKDDRGHDRKRRKLAGEDDTDMDIRLARVATGHNNEDWEDAKILKLRSTAHDAPLTDHAGNIDLFPVDMKDAIKHEKNAEVEKEKRKKEQSFEDQYTMRFSNAAGKEGLSKPWYATEHDPASKSQQDNELTAYSGFESKDVWGNEEPRRREREQARIISNDPFAFMQKAQTQLKKSKEDRKKWAAERDRELRELRATQERENRKSRHHKRKRRDEEDDKTHRSDRHTREASSKHRHYRRSRSRSHSRDKHAHKSSRHHNGIYDSKNRDRHRDDRTKHESHRRRDDGEILVEGHGVS